LCAPYADHPPMRIGIVTAQISIPESRSLKDKRSVLRSMKDRAVLKMNVSVAEVGQQDQWRFADMAFVTVAATTEVVQRRISEITRFLQSDPRYVLMDVQTEIM